jgi:hypothetical protein
MRAYALIVIKLFLKVILLLSREAWFLIKTDDAIYPEKRVPYWGRIGLM